MTVERKYAMTKIEKGDWLLPSNDGKTVWRIRICTELAPSPDGHGDREVDHWEIWRWLGSTLTAFAGGDVEDWSQWDFYEGYHKTRKDAVDSALRLK